MRNPPRAAKRPARWLGPGLGPGLALFGLLAAWSPPARGQWTKVPLRSHAPASRGPLTHSTARPQALGLPFFDDFADNATRPPALASLPDPARWAGSGGVDVNNTVARNQPSLYVATLDGLRASGTPYDPERLTCAHKALPLGTLLRVARGGTAITCLVNDRGPFVGDRVLDLSRADSRALGYDGTAEVVAEVLQPQ